MGDEKLPDDLRSQVAAHRARESEANDAAGRQRAADSERRTQAQQRWVKIQQWAGSVATNAKGRIPTDVTLVEYEHQQGLFKNKTTRSIVGRGWQLVHHSTDTSSDADSWSSRGHTSTTRRGILLTDKGRLATYRVTDGGTKNMEVDVNAGFYDPSIGRDDGTRGQNLFYLPKDMHELPRLVGELSVIADGRAYKGVDAIEYNIVQLAAKLT